MIGTSSAVPLSPCPPPTTTSLKLPAELDNRAPSSASTLSTSSASSCSLSTKHHDASLLIGGFQWLKIKSGGHDDETTSSPLVDRSCHSHGSLGGRGGSYSYDDEDDDNYQKSHFSLGPLQQSPFKRRHHIRMRSRSESPTSSVMGFDNNECTDDTFMRLQRRPRLAIGKGGTFGSPGNNTSNGSDYELKNARDALIGSVSALINFLRSAGVPKPSTDQLEKNLELGRYFATMKRSMDYTQCIESQNEDELLAKVHLAVNAWEALCRVKALEYKRAYKHAYSLRYGHSAHNFFSDDLSKNSSHHQNATTAMATASQPSPAEIKQAIEMQIKMAEQCTLCQKKLYLVHKWRQRVLQRTKKAALIEPQGYQAIRCVREADA